MHSESERSALMDTEACSDKLAWFCVRSQPKHEHIAAGHLRQYDDVEVFNPRIQFTRNTRYGPVEVKEALFPGYLFARFDWETCLAKVNYAMGVKDVVHFGCKWPTIPDSVIEELQHALGTGELHRINSDLAPGDKVNVAGGVFHGLEAVITQVLPGRERVVVLMHFLGRQTTVELESNTIIKGSTYD